MWMLVRSLARNENTLAGRKTLVRDIGAGADGSVISDSTVADYLDSLKRIFLTEDLPAYSPNLRSSIKVGKADKRHLCDPSLAVAALGADLGHLKKDPNTLGFLFESLCVHDLIVYAGCRRGKVYHYRDSYGNEIDAVVEMPGGAWAGFEIRLGAKEIDKGAENLVRVNKIFTEDGNESAAALCVISGTADRAYTRQDGVRVFPLTALRD